MLTVRRYSIWPQDRDELNWAPIRSSYKITATASDVDDWQPLLHQRCSQLALGYPLPELLQVPQQVLRSIFPASGGSLSSVSTIRVFTSRHIELILNSKAGLDATAHTTRHHTARRSADKLSSAKGMFLNAI